jgi:hypothetical protein
MLLSMDIVVERFLEIGASDLLVLAIGTAVARLIVYRSMRNILILKYWTRKAKYHDLAHCWHF